MTPRFANLIVSRGCGCPCSARKKTGVLQGSSCSSPDCWEQGSSCSSASSSASWRLDAAVASKQHQLGTSVYSKLRVSIPGALNSDTAGSSPVNGSSPGTCAASVGSGSCASTPGSYPLLCGPALHARNGPMLAGHQGPFTSDEQQGGCLSSSAARRLLACDGNDSAEVSNWLDHQISMRQGVGASNCNVDGPGAPELEKVEVLGAAACGCFNKRGLPRPAFQLLGLL